MPEAFDTGKERAIVSTWLFTTYRSSISIAIYIVLMAVVGIISTALPADGEGRFTGPKRTSCPAPAMIGGAKRQVRDRPVPVTTQ
jgi:hypothetical protein